MPSEPAVKQAGDHWCSVSGVFYRAVNPAFRDTAIVGSRLAGRYSEPAQSTLYLSSSPRGVDAAMIAHTQARVPDLVLLELRVEADNIVDLRDPAALVAAGVDLADAVAPWPDIVKTGGQPPSWHVRRRLESLGANGLIDPSRKRSGLWHLTLFKWNSSGAPSVAIE